MNFFGQREQGHNNYRSNARRNSNSFIDGETGPKRKRWTKRGRGNAGGGSRNVETVSPQPLFKEPITSPRRSPAQNRNRGNYSQNGPSSARSQQYFDMRDMPKFVEPEHSGSQWSWDNYSNNCKAWQDRHKLAYYKSRCMALEFENQMLYDQIGLLVEENCVFAVERGEVPSMRLPELPGGSELPMERSNNKNTTQKKNEGKDKATFETSTELEFVVTEEMMEHLEKSIRHKLNLRKQRKEEAEKKKITEATLKKTEMKKEEERPKHPPGLKRKEELEMLYGENSSLIQKLETATQLNFNRNCDTLKPDLWPAVAYNRETLAE